MAITLNPVTILNGGGIDVNSLVTQIQALQSNQLMIWQQEQADLQTQASGLASMSTDLGSLSTAINALSDIFGPLTQLAATSSQPSILTATTNSAATAGSHTVVVSTLASAGTVYTSAVGDASASLLADGVNSGTIEVQIGGASGTTKTIAITRDSNDTLSTLSHYINDQSTANNWGVTATILTDSTGQRLAITSKSTGSSQKLTIASNDTKLDFKDPIGGSDATFTVDGIGFSSDSNTVSGALPGITMNLLAAYPDVQVHLSVSQDTVSAMQAITDFVYAYNKVIGDINQQFTVDPVTNTEGPLGSDTNLRVLQSMLLSGAAQQITTDGNFLNLATLGIDMNNDGSLTINQTSSPDQPNLSSLLASNPQAVLNFFQNDSQTGFANLLKTTIDKLNDSVDGIFNVDLAQNKIQQQDLTDRINAFEDQLATQKTALTAQLNLVNATLQSYPALLMEINLLLGLNPSSNSSTGG